jgi:hypothetical protein
MTAASQGDDLREVLAAPGVIRMDGEAGPVAAAAMVDGIDVITQLSAKPGRALHVVPAAVAAEAMKQIDDFVLLAGEISADEFVAVRQGNVDSFSDL